MQKRCLGLLGLTLTFTLIGCSGGDAVKMGTTPQTAIAASHTFPYPVGPGGGGTPNPKDLIPGKIPGKGGPGKK